MNEQDTLKHIAQNPDEVLLLRRLLDKQRQARRGQASASRFLTGHERVLAQRLMAGLQGENYAFWGGYEAAERCILQFWPEWETRDPEAVAALRLEYEADSGLTHRDLLGALMALGLTRNAVGDILVSGSSADVLILPELTEFAVQNLERIGRSRVRCQRIPLSELRVPQQAYRSIRDTVASPRLDSVLASGLHLSREKAAQLIRTGAVQVDHVDCTKPDRQLSSGALLSVRGYGRLRLESLGEPTRKGRYPVVILKYE